MPDLTSDISGNIVIYPPKNKMTAKVAIIPIGDSNLTSNMNVKRVSQITSSISVYADYAIESISPPIYASQKRGHLIIPHRNDFQANIGIKPNGVFTSIIDVVPKPKTIVKLFPVEDAFVRSAVQTLNYGSGNNMEVGYDSSKSEIYRSLVKFDISSIPTNKTILSATLKLYNNSIANIDQNIGLYDAVSNWTETGVTWKNQPYVDSLVVSQNIKNQSGYISFDVTNLLGSWYDGSLYNNGFVIKALNESIQQFVVFSTRENSNNQQPYLEISYYDTIVYTFTDTKITGNLHVVGHTQKDLTASINVHYNDNLSTIRGNLSVHQLGDIVINNLSSNIAVNRVQLISNISARRSVLSDLTGNVNVRLVNTSDLPSNIIANRIQINGNIYVPYKNDLSSSVAVRQVGHSDFPSNILANHRQVAGNMIVPYRNDFNAHIDVRGLAIADFNSHIGINRYQITGSIIVRRSDKLELSSNVSVKRNALNDFSSHLQISRNWLDSNIQVVLSSYLSGNMTVRGNTSNNLNSNIYVLNRSDLVSHINVIGANMINANLYVMSGYIKANIIVPTHQKNDLIGNMKARISFINDLTSSINVGGDNLDLVYAFII